MPTGITDKDEKTGLCRFCVRQAPPGQILPVGKTHRPLANERHESEPAERL